MSHFVFLQAEWPELAAEARKAEGLVYPDPRTACFYARRALELAAAWLYKHDSALKLPYQDNLAALLAEPTFQHLVGPKLSAKARIVKDLGNLAVHSRKPVRDRDAVQTVGELFHFAYWIARTYARQQKPAQGLAFNPADLPRTSPVPPQTAQQLQRLETDLEATRERLTEILGKKAGLDEELKRLRAEIAAVKKANSAILDSHDYSEAETRDYFIDLLLEGSRLAARSGARPRVSCDRHADRKRRRLCGLCAVGRRRQAARAGGGQAHQKDPRSRPAAGEALCRLPGEAVWPAAGDLLFQRLRAWLWDDVRYPPRVVQGFLQAR